MPPRADGSVTANVTGIVVPAVTPVEPILFSTSIAAVRFASVPEYSVEPPR